jgi:hypothetical protein
LSFSKTLIPRVTASLFIFPSVFDEERLSSPVQTTRLNAMGTAVEEEEPS